MAEMIYKCGVNDSIVKTGEWYAYNIPTGAFLLSPNMGFVKDGGMIDLTANMYTQWKNALGGVSYEFGCYLQNDILITTDYTTMRNELTRFNAERVYHDLTDELAEKLVYSVNNVHEWHARFPSANLYNRLGFDYELTGSIDCLQTNSQGDLFSPEQTWGYSIIWACFEGSNLGSSTALKLALYNIQADIANGDIECSEELKSLLDDTLVSGLISSRGVDWVVNIDGTSNPIISLTWSNEMAEKYHTGAVEVRAYSIATNAMALTEQLKFDTSKFVGRGGYASKMQYTFDSLYTDSNNVAFLEDWTKFLQNYITKPFSGYGAIVELFFRLTYNSDGLKSSSSWCYCKIDEYGEVSGAGVARIRDNDGDGSTVTITRQNTDDVFDETSFDDETDVIDNSIYGVSALSLLTKTYKMTTSRLKQLGDFLWDRDFTDSILDVNQSPIENIVSCKVFPFDINNTEGEQTIILGNVNTGVLGYPVTENANFVINIGVFQVPKFYNNWIDYSNELTKIGIFLPFCGFFNLDTNEVMGKTVNVKYYVDILTGVCKAVIFVNDIAVQEFGGQIGFDIPLTSQNRAQVELAQITSFASGVGALATGNVGGAVSGFANGIIRPKDNFQTCGSLSPTVNMMTTHDVFIVIERPIVQYPSNYGHVYGYPCFLKYKLNNLSGYTKCANVDVSNVPCTDREKDIIKSYLEGGVII